MKDREIIRKTCTKDNPFINIPIAHIGGYTKIVWSHPDAKEVDEDYGSSGVCDGDYVKYRCPHCEKEWWEELPN